MTRGKVVRRIRLEIRARMIETRDFYAAKLIALREADSEPESVILAGWIEAKLRECDNAAHELLPKNENATGPVLDRGDAQID